MTPPLASQDLSLDHRHGFRSPKQRDTSRNLVFAVGLDFDGAVQLAA